MSAQKAGIEQKELSASGESLLKDEEDRSEAESEEEEAEEEPVVVPPYLLGAHFRARTGPLDFHSTGSVKAVQAVVLAAGSGSRMTTLVTGTPKCLLPIATIPMLYYPLHMLQASGFTKCLVVVSSGCEERVADLAIQYGLTIKLDIHTVNSSEDPGTLDSIRHIAGSLIEEAYDILIVSSDIVSDINVTEMVESHRCKGAALTMLTAPVDTKSFAPTPGLKHKSTIGPDLLIESVSEKRLVASICGGDYGEEINLPPRILKCGSLMVTAMRDVQEAHLYVISARLLKNYVLSDKTPCSRMTSMKAEVVPHLIDLQFRSQRHPKYDEATSLFDEPFRSLITYFNSSMKPGPYSQSWPQSAGGRACYTHHYDSGFCIRANNIPAYWHLNTVLPALLPTLFPTCPVRALDFSNSEVQPKAVVRGNTLLGRGCLLSDRTTVTDSSLGRNCLVPPGCRINNSVLMDNVQLQPGCVVDSCIVCCTIDKEKCTLKNSIVASSRTLQPNKTVTGDTLEATQFFSA